MKEINERELNKLADIINLFHVEKNKKQLERLINRLKALNKKYSTNELRDIVSTLVDLLTVEYPDSEELEFLRIILNPNCDVICIGHKVMGFYLPADQQIVPLPIPIHVIDASKYRILKVEFSRFNEEEIRYWRNLGFDWAIPLPYKYREIEGISVLLVEKISKLNSEALEYGFSPPVLIITPMAFDVWCEIEHSIGKEKLIPKLLQTTHRYRTHR